MTNDPAKARIAELERRTAELARENARLATRLASTTKPADEQLRESEWFYRQTLESIPGMVFTASPTGACDYVSEQWVEFTALPATELLGDDWVAVLHPQDRIRAFSTWRAAVEGLRQYDLEFRVRRKDGVYKWFKVRGCAIRDAAGAVVRWLGVAVNVDDLKRAEAALGAREGELQTLTDNVPDALYRIDRQLRFVFVNPALQAAIGVEPGEALGKTSRDLGMPADLCELWDSATVAVFEHRQPRSVEFTLEGSSGLRHYATRLVPELGPGGYVEHVLAVTHDVTDIKRAQEALEDADRRKDEFLATLAHELRNPLAPLRTGLEVLRRSGMATEAQAKAHEMMERQLAHLVRLVDDLLDVARISHGTVEIKPKPVEVRTIVEHAVETTRPLIEARGHALGVHVPHAPVSVRGDLTRLAQVVGNLLNNAAKYTPTGGRIELGAEVEGDAAVIRVTDTGIGISTEMLPRVFDLFARGDRITQSVQSGLGIGLSLVRRLVELHGGSVAAQSHGLGRGSTFTVRLPLASAAGGAPVPASPTSRRVLVVDDNTDAAETLAMLLELNGHEAQVAGSGQAALEAARSWQPDIIFLDIGMPGMDGYEVARRLRADPSTAGALLVAVTGWGSEDDKRKSKDAGFDLHLIKPVQPEAVADVLARRPAPRGADANGGAGSG